MKYALIATNEQVKDGFRVVEVTTNQFEVAPQLIWKDCPDEVFADKYYYKPDTDSYELTNPEIDNTEGTQPDVIG